MRKAISICLVFIICFSITFSSNFNNNLYADEIIRVDPTSSGQMQPGIYGTKIAWEDIRDGISQIYIHDLVTDNSFPIDPTTSYQSWASINEDKVVWEDDRDGFYQIYLYDLSDPTANPVRISPTTSDQLYPDIFGDIIVWADSRDGQYQIYMYSIATDTITRLDPTSSSQMHPDIYENRIVWTDYRDGNWQVYLYEISSGIATRLSPSSNDQYKPSIFGNKIVWQEQAQIKLHDISAGTDSILSPSTSSNRMHPDISGNHVIWLDNKDGEWQVYLYNLEGVSDPVRISPSVELQDYPKIYGSKIVWSDWRDLGSDPQTYLYTIPFEKTEPLVFPYFMEKIKGFFLSMLEIISQIIESLISSSNIPEKDKEQTDEDSVGDKDIKEEETEEVIDEQSEEENGEIEKEKEAVKEEDKEISELLKTIPSIELSIKEGPAYSEENGVCFYRVEAIISGEPPPRVEFSKDDSNGAWGPFIVQVNLSDPTETYNLSATVTNTEGTDTDSIKLSWGCTEQSDEELVFPSGQIVLHPSDIGHIIQHFASPNVVDTTTLIIGDSISNTNIRGYFAFDVSSLSGMEIISASLVLNTYKLYDDPSFKDFIGLRWGTYLPLDPDDYLMLGTHPVTSFDNGKEPIEFSREDLVVAIDNMANIANDKLQFTIGYSNESSDGDGVLDGRKYRNEDIALYIEFTD